MAQSTASLEGQYQPSQANLRETMFTAHGVGVVKGIAIGRAVVMGTAALEVPHYYIVHEAVAQELERLAHAIARVQQELDSQIEAMPADAPRELQPYWKLKLWLLDVRWFV